MICVDCQAPLEPDDGHDRCPSCFGIEHLKQGLTQQACMNCNCLSLTARAARLAQLERGWNSQQPSAQRDCVVSPKEQRSRRAESREAPSESKRRKIDPLAQKVDNLASEFAEIKALLLNLQ